MANKRQLKKQIHYACGALATQCIIAGETVNGIDTKSMADIVIDITHLQQTSLERCSFIFDKSEADFANAHEYNTAKHKYNAEAYSRLIKEFNEQVAQLLHRMNTLLPDEQREANKKAANK